MKICDDIACAKFKKTNSMTLYIAGPVSSVISKNGYLHCYYKFDKLTKRLEQTRMFDKIYNPMKLCSANWSWLRCMIVCLYYLIIKCDAIYMMPDWESSRGATIEHSVAKRLNKRIIYEL